MIKLEKSLEGKKVVIIDIYDDVYEGTISDYIYPEDNEPEGIACVCMINCIQEPGKCIGFNEDEIISINVMHGGNK